MKITCIKNLSWSDVNKTEFYEIAGEAASKGYLDIIKNKTIPNAMRPKFRNKAQSNIYFLSQRKVTTEKKRKNFKKN